MKVLLALFFALSLLNINIVLADVIITNDQNHATVIDPNNDDYPDDQKHATLIDPNDATGSDQSKHATVIDPNNQGNLDDGQQVRHHR